MRLTLSALCAFFLVSFAAEAQVRTFVATSGLDTNPCTRTQPCRNFGTALAATLTGGEVVALDSGGYGPVVIDRSITITAPASVHAAIAPTSGVAVTVAAAAADAVTVRGLFLNSQGGTYGVLGTSFAALQLEGITINRFSKGISVFVDAAANLSIADVIVRNGGDNGIEVGGATVDPLKGIVSRSRIENQGLNALIVFQGAQITAVDTTVVGAIVGFRTASDTGRLMVERCTASGNSWGVYTTFGGLEVSNSTLTFNGTGIGGGGTINSRGNNTVRMNGTNGAFTATFAAQ